MKFEWFSQNKKVENSFQKNIELRVWKLSIELTRQTILYKESFI